MHNAQGKLSVEPKYNLICSPGTSVLSRHASRDAPALPAAFGIVEASQILTSTKQAPLLRTIPPPPTRATLRLMSDLTSMLPQGPGLLPYWYLITAAAGIYNSVQNMVVTWQTKEIYSARADEVTPLACRLAATWTGLTGLVRLLAAYNLNDATVYRMGQSTFLIALIHFSTELFVFKSIKLNRASISPLIIAPTSLLWTVIQQGFYVK